MSTTPSYYKALAADVADINSEIDRIQHRLQQGAIAPETAAERLRALADRIEVLG